MDNPKATMVIEGLNEQLFKPGRRERMEPLRRMTPVLDERGQPTGRVEEGEVLPREEQLVLGQVLINLLMTTKTEGMSPGKIRLLGKLVDRLEEKTAAGEPYDAGEMALGWLREAAKQNGMNYRPYLLAQVLDIIGTGEKATEEILVGRRVKESRSDYATEIGGRMAGDFLRPDIINALGLTSGRW